MFEKCTCGFYCCISVDAVPFLESIVQCYRYPERVSLCAHVLKFLGTLSHHPPLKPHSNSLAIKRHSIFEK
jgi:hypothetical protein